MRPIHKRVAWLLSQQLLIACLAAIILLLLGRQLASLSILAGAGVFWLTAQIFAWRIFRQVQLADKTFLTRFYRAELMKLIFSIGLLVLIISHGSLSALWVSSGYLLAQLSIFILPGWRCLRYFEKND